VGNYMKYNVKLIAISALLICSFFEVYSQSGPYGYYNDALLFSQSRYGGSARVQGMGGVQIGLGGDVSNILSNPAGLGFFNRSEVSFTPSVNFHSTSTDYINTTTDAFDTRFNINNIGIVFNRSRNRQIAGDWRGGSFGISFTRINNLNNEFRYRGNNPGTSIIDYFLNSADGRTPNQLSGLTELAYYNYLINPEGPPQNLYNSFVIGFPQLQEETVSTSGGQNQWSLSYGGNYADKVYFGLGLGFTSLDYLNEKVYREGFVGEPINNLQINERFRVNGGGINGTIGVIVRPNDMFRFGASFVTPTVYYLNDESSFILSTNYNNFYYPEEDTVLNSLVSESSITVSNYNLQTPMRVNAGVAYFFGKDGFISADIEYLNYRSNRLSTNAFSMDEDNQTIRNLYNSAINFKLGGEYRYEIFRFRAGGGYYSDPFAVSDGLNRARLNFSVGIGLRLPTFFMDLAVLNNRFNSSYIPYDDAMVPTAEIRNNSTSGILTVGFNF
jgi:hypothetical protein